MPNTPLTDLVNSIIGHHNIWGDSRSGYAYAIDEDKFKLSPVMVPCKLCGSTHQMVVNTHTPSYTIECKCGVDVSLPTIDFMYTIDQGVFQGPFSTKESAVDNHRLALSLVVRRWNCLMFTPTHTMMREFLKKFIDDRIKLVETYSFLADHKPSEFRRQVNFGDDLDIDLLQDLGLIHVSDDGQFCIKSPLSHLGDGYV